MNLRGITGAYFSPAGHTKTVVELLLSQMKDGKGWVDLTDAGKRPDYGFTEDEAVIVGAPVYAGRIPSTAVKRLKKLHGRKTPAILVVTYGNRAYEDALAELEDIMIDQGFCPVAAAAVSVQHSVVTKIAADRPDDSDRRRLREFAAQTEKKLDELVSIALAGDLKVPGNRPYRPYHSHPIKINVGSGCNGCGVCIRRCPVQAISRTDAKITDEERCISCMRCVAVCPTQSRKISRFLYLALSQKLKKLCAERREPEFFL